MVSFHHYWFECQVNPGWAQKWSYLSKKQNNYREAYCKKKIFKNSQKNRCDGNDFRKRFLWNVTLLQKGLPEVWGFCLEYLFRGSLTGDYFYRQAVKLRFLELTCSHKSKIVIHNKNNKTRASFLLKNQLSIYLILFLVDYPFLNRKVSTHWEQTWTFSWTSSTSENFRRVNVAVIYFFPIYRIANCYFLIPFAIKIKKLKTSDWFSVRSIDLSKNQLEICNF